jgi:hypothetical protein
MFFVVRRVMGKPSFSTWEQDPRTYSDYKRDKLSYLDIVHLTPLGEQQSLAALRDAWIEGVFDRPSPYKEAEKPKEKAAPETAEGIAGAKRVIRTIEGKNWQFRYDWRGIAFFWGEEDHWSAQLHWGRRPWIVLRHGHDIKISLPRRPW